MLKAQRELLIGNVSHTIGNHSVWISGPVREYRYHGNVICHVDFQRNTIIFDNCGWNTSSTTRAINGYREHFKLVAPTLKELDPQKFDAGATLRTEYEHPPKSADSGVEAEFAVVLALVLCTQG